MNTEDNKLIAEFMGVDIHEFVMNGGKKWEYHSSWDWLMPVVEKIENIVEPITKKKYNIRINQGFFTEIFVSSGREDDFRISKSANTRREATYKAVVEFIKWYNKEKVK